MKPAWRSDYAGSRQLRYDEVFTRSGIATRWNRYGVLETVAANQPRFDFDPVTFACRGLLIEESRTNSVRNSSMVGGAAGSPGTPPTNHTYTAAGSGLSRDIAMGVEDGIAYVDVRFYGTATIALTRAFLFETSTTSPAASAGQSWTSSAFAKLQAGSTDGCTFALGVVERDSSNAIIATPIAVFTPTAAPLRTQRRAYPYAVSNASTATIAPRMEVAIANGATVDFTLRIGLPSIELGAFATSPIPTTTAAVTRAADSLYVVLGSWWNPNEWTVQAEWDTVWSGPTTSIAGSPPGVMCFYSQAASGLNGYSLRETLSGTARPTVSCRNAASTISAVTTGQGNVVAGNANRAVMASSAAGIAVGMNGQLVTNTNANYGLDTMDRLFVGTQLTTGGTPRELNGHIRRLAYFNSRLADAQLQALTL